MRSSSSPPFGRRLRLFIVTLLGGLGYFWCALQWMWAMILYMPLIEKDNIVEKLTLSGDQGTLLPTIQFTLSPAIAGILAVVITIIVVGLVVYLTFTMPRRLTQSAARSTHHMAKHTIPFIMRQRHLSQTQQKSLSFRVLVIIKLHLCILPLIVTSCTPIFTPFPLVSTIVMPIAYALFFCSITCFMTQTFLAHRWRLGFDRTA